MIVNIRDYLTDEQYDEQYEQYQKLVKNNEISFIDFLTKTYELQKD